MACSEGRKLSAYLDAELPLPERACLEEHLCACSACRRELAELEQLEDLLAQLSPVSGPPELLDATMARARHELRPVRRYTRGWVAVSAAAAILLIFLHIGLFAPAPEVPSSSLTSVESAPALAVTMSLPAAPKTQARPRQHIRMASGHRPGGHLARRTRTPREIVTPTASPQALEAVAAAAYQEASGHASSDPDLSVAALENVAAAYPKSRQAAKALLAAGNLEQRCGNFSEADVTYRRVLALPAQTPLSQGLAHKALGDMRRQSVGDDEVALYHYQQAARALRREAARPAGPQAQALVALADVERQMGERERAAADYATLANSGSKSPLGEHSSAALAEVL